MGKQMSKGGIRSAVRRQRSQSIAQPAVVASPDPPRLSPETTDRAVLTLKLQRDELTVYKGRLTALLRKEDDIVRRLIKEGKSERARLLLQKKRLQEHILHEAEHQLNAIIGQVSTPAALEEVRKEAEQVIDRNSESIKRLHALLSMENAELMLRESYEGAKKQSEIDQLLLLATVAEREFLEKDVEMELRKMTTALGLMEEPEPRESSANVEGEKQETDKPIENQEPLVNATEDKTDTKEVIENKEPAINATEDKTNSKVETENKEPTINAIEDKTDTKEEIENKEAQNKEETENELEALAIQKLHENEQDIKNEAATEEDDELNHQSDVVTDSGEEGVPEEKAGPPEVVVSKAVSSISKLNTIAADEQSASGASESSSKTNQKEVASNIFPDVPRHAIEISNEEEVAVDKALS